MSAKRVPVKKAPIKMGGNEPVNGILHNISVQLSISFPLI